MAARRHRDPPRARGVFSGALALDRQRRQQCAVHWLRAGNRVARGRKIISVVSSHWCCLRGHAQHLCPWPKPPQWAPAEAGAAPS
eukprot:scaffold6910_cov136-Isochrysis_galbana.AAC.3